MVEGESGRQNKKEGIVMTEEVSTTYGKETKNVHQSKKAMRTGDQVGQMSTDSEYDIC
jgi:hypothetical protein